jgi:hypothetical protein
MQGMVGYLYDYTQMVIQKSHIETVSSAMVSYRVAYLPLPLFLLLAIMCAYLMKETYHAHQDSA